MFGAKRVQEPKTCMTTLPGWPIWKLCCEYGFNRNEKWCEHQPDEVEENERCKILWDMTIQCDHIIEARRPDIVVD